MNMATKQEIIREKLKKYLKATKEEKSRILDMLEEATGYVRDAIIRRLRTLQLRSPWWKDGRGGARVVYGADVTAALKDVWEIASRIGAERLHAAMHEHVRIMQRDRVWKHGADAAKKVCAMSLGTMKSRLASFESERGRKGIGSTIPSMLKEIIPIRRGPWENPRPGFGEVDTVAHCGMTLLGEFGYTVQYTDVATIWTALSAQWNKGQEATRASEEYVRTHLPFIYLHRHTDTGSEFITHEASAWGQAHNIKLTRSRPYQKNDNMLVEERNGHIVRKYVGYIRLDARETVSVLNDLYLTLNLYTNHFIPSRKTILNVRVGAKYKRKYEKAKTPYQRVLNHHKIGEEVKTKLK